MVPPTQSSAVAGYDKPKGVGALFVKVACPPSDVLDVRNLCKATGKAFTAIARLLLLLSFVVVPAWLWLLRNELALKHHGDAAAIAVMGVVIFLICDALVSSSNAAKAEASRGLIVAGSVPYQKVPPVVHAPLAAQNSAPAPPAVQQAAPRAPAVHGAAPSGARALPPVADPETYHAVKRAIINLEGVLFGNELTEGDIARDQLHIHVSNLCNEVGVAFPEGDARAIPLTQLQQLLAQVATTVGVTDA